MVKLIAVKPKVNANKPVKPRWAELVSIIKKSFREPINFEQDKNIAFLTQNIVLESKGWILELLLKSSTSIQTIEMNASDYTKKEKNLKNLEEQLASLFRKQAEIKQRFVH